MFLWTEAKLVRWYDRTTFCSSDNVAGSEGSA